MLVAGPGLPADGLAQPRTGHQAPAADGERAHGGAAAHGTAHGHAAPRGQGGEGGEGGEAGAFANAPPDLAYAARLALIRGHLAIGRELMEAGAWSEALPHFLHPTEEIYDELAEGLRERGVAGFRAELDGLAQAVRRRDAAAAAQRRRAAETALARAEAGLPAATREEPGFVGALIAAVLRQAAEEYEEAVEQDRIANAVEYQDGRGFLGVARSLLERHGPALRAKDARAHAEVTELLGRMAAAWPAPRAPQRARLTPGEVSALASRVELAASGWR
jgi:hypothetical protein